MAATRKITVPDFGLEVWVYDKSVEIVTATAGDNAVLGPFVHLNSSDPKFDGQLTEFVLHIFNAGREYARSEIRNALGVS